MNDAYQVPEQGFALRVVSLPPPLELTRRMSKLRHVEVFNSIGLKASGPRFVESMPVLRRRNEPCHCEATEVFFA
jgi:hypothetical protein